MGTTLVSQEETLELVKNLKAVLPVSDEPAVDVQSPEFVVAPSCETRCYPCSYGLSFPVPFRSR